MFSGKNGYTFQCITFFFFTRFYRNDQNLRYQLFGITRARLADALNLLYIYEYVGRLQRRLEPGSGEKAKNLPVFVNDTTQRHFCFRCEKKNSSTIWRTIFTEILVKW